MIAHEIMIVGVLIMFGSMVWQYVKVFRYSVYWGFICLCFPPASMLFALKYFPVVKRSYLAGLAGLGVVGLGMLLLAIFE